MVQPFFFCASNHLQELAPAFEAASGHKLKIEYATAGVVEQKVASDDEIDVAILTKPGVDKLVRAAKTVDGSTKMLATAQIGVAVKKSVAYPDPAAGATSGRSWGCISSSELLGNRLRSPERSRSNGTTDLLVKEVNRSGRDANGKPWRRRYIACLNEAEAKKDAVERDAILAGLDEALRRGDKSLVGNRGYPRKTFS